MGSLSLKCFLIFFFLQSRQSAWQWLRSWCTARYPVLLFPCTSLICCNHLFLDISRRETRDLICSAPQLHPCTHTTKGIWERDIFIMGIQGSLTRRVSKYAIQNDVVFLLPFPVRWHKTFHLMARKPSSRKNGCTGQRSFSPWALPPPPDTSSCLDRSVVTGQAYIKLPPFHT